MAAKKTVKKAGRPKGAKNPFGDKRMKRPGNTDTQPAKKAARKRIREQQRVRRGLPTQKEELERLKQEVTTEKIKLTKTQNKHNELLEAMEKAPTPAAQRKIVLGMITESGLNPLKELLDMAKAKTGAKALPPEKRRDLLLKLLEYQAPKPKSIDIQADVSSSLTIQVTDFSNTTQKELKQAQPENTPQLAEDAAYDEFLSPEQIALREKEKAIEMAVNAAVDDELEDEDAD